FDRVHDEYLGIWAVYANDDIYEGSELIFKKGDLLQDSAGHEAEPFKDFFAVDFDEDTYTFQIAATDKYLDLIGTRSDLSNAFSLYTKMQRIAPSERIENKVTESYNNFERESNITWTFTKENPGVAVEKFTLTEGSTDGDRDDVRLAYEITEDQLKLAELPEDAAEGTVALQNGVEVGIRLTNTGDVPLNNVKVTDITHDGLYGNLQGIVCAVPADPMAPVMIQGGGATDAAGESEDGMTWALASSVTELGYGETVDCKGTLRDMAPGMTHGDTVVVTGESVFTAAAVKAEDAWFATAASAPAIDVVKYTLEEGALKGDRDTFKEALVLTPEQAKNGVKIGFDVRNTGDEPLTNISFEDVAQDATTGTVENVTWFDLIVEEPVAEEDPVEEETVPIEGVAAAAAAATSVALVEDAAPEAPEAPAALSENAIEIGGKFYIERPLEELTELAVGQAVLLAGTLTGVKAGTSHIAIAAVTAEGKYSGTEVSDSDPWNAKLPAVQVPPLAPPRVAVTGDPLAEAGAPWLFGGAALLLAAAAATAYGIRRRLRYAREEAARFGSGG
ncbi:MAG: LPXTG cell wall anchor domain-containing protein, partial [Mycetocola sp.]